jgi:uncharacterized coiled-coil protein SlyX
MKNLFYPLSISIIFLFSGCINIDKEKIEQTTDVLDVSNTEFTKVEEELNKKVSLLQKTIDKQNKKISLLNKERNELRSKVIKLESKDKITNNPINTWKKYENKNYFFGLDFTDEWKNFLVKQSDIKGDALNPDYISLDFGFFVASEKSFVQIFSISIYKKSILNEDEILTIKQKESFLEENNKYIYTFVDTLNPIEGLKKQIETLPSIRNSFVSRDI